MRYQVFFWVIILLAILLRVASLSLRPMHTDEAIHAFKFAEMMESGTYIYDKHEYHGPTLNYLTIISAGISSKTDLVSLNETTLRLVPAVVGVLLIMLLLLLLKPLGWRMLSIIVIFLAVSPALVFYSRYYIQEVLLIFFNAGIIIAFYRFAVSRKILWILGSGIFAGFMMATKETWVIIVFSQFAALVLAYWFYPGMKEKWQNHKENGFLRPALYFLLPAILVAIILFSSGFMNMQGIPDSVMTYLEYFKRAGSNTHHIHPWYYYFQMVTIDACVIPFIRADVWIIIFGLGGIIVTFRKRFSKVACHPIFWFVSVYTLISAFLFSIIPYKTPWNILAFYFPLTLLSGYFFYTIIDNYKSGWVKGISRLIFFLAIVHLFWQSYHDNFRTYDDPCNPYVYAHPGEDVLKIAALTEKIAASSAEGKKLYIEVIVPENGYWSLPWYLRDFANVGWWSEVDNTVPAAPMIICSSELNEQLTHKLFGIPPPGQRYLYIPMFEQDPELRPGVRVSVYLRKDYWDNYMAGMKSLP